MACAQQQSAIRLNTVVSAEDPCQVVVLRMTRCQAGDAHARTGPCAGWSRLPQHGAHICVVVGPSEPAGARLPRVDGCRHRVRQPAAGPMTSPHRGGTEVGDAQAAELAVAFPDRAVGQALQQGIQRPAGDTVIMLARGAGAKACFAAAQPVPGLLHNVPVDRGEPARGSGLAHKPARVARAHPQRRAQAGNGHGVRVCLKRQPGQVTIIGLAGVAAHGATWPGQQVRRGV